MKALALLCSCTRGRPAATLLALSLLGAISLPACAAHPVPQAVHYPSLAKSQPASPAAPSGFEPAAALTPLALACRADELPEPNALDDDCNQHIDDGLSGPGAPAASEAEADAVVLVLAYPQTAPIQLSLRGEGGLATIDLTPTDCSHERSFCTARFAVRQLAPGRHTLVASGAALAAGVPPPSVVVSVQSRGRVTTYLASVPPGIQELPLGQLALP